MKNKDQKTENKDKKQQNKNKNEKKNVSISLCQS